MAFDHAVVGLGYVGLPLARAAVAVGGSVVGVDVAADRVERLNAGRSPVDTVSDTEIATMLRRGFTATTDPAVLATCETVVICVPTPLNERQEPDLGPVRAAAATVGRHLRPGTLVVLESTVWPGATETVVLPLLERDGLRAGVDFHLAYSPERIDPGNPHHSVENTPKVVAGHTTACRDRASAFYGKVVAEVVPVSGLREAELTKLLENIYRSVNIALMNEMAAVCDTLGVDLWEAIEAAATKPFGFARFQPGPGVGGHCIPVDPVYLTHTARVLGRPSRLVELAVEVNARMPDHVFARVNRMLGAAGVGLCGARVLLVGVTYKPDVADIRHTPAEPLARALRRAGAHVTYLDPLLDTWEVDGTAVPAATDPAAAVARCDLAVLLQPHQALDLNTLIAAGHPVLDTTGVLPATTPGVERL